MVYRDLELVLTAALAQGIPLIIGSAGTAGARPQLDATVAMLRAIAQAKGQKGAQAFQGKIWPEKHDKKH